MMTCSFQPFTLAMLCQAYAFSCVLLVTIFHSTFTNVFLLILRLFLRILRFLFGKTNTAIKNNVTIFWPDCRKRPVLKVQTFVSSSRVWRPRTACQASENLRRAPLHRRPSFRRHCLRLMTRRKFVRLTARLEVSACNGSSWLNGRFRDAVISPFCNMENTCLSTQTWTLTNSDKVKRLAPWVQLRPNCKAVFTLHTCTAYVYAVQYWRTCSL